MVPMNFGPWIPFPKNLGATVGKHAWLKLAYILLSLIFCYFIWHAVINTTKPVYTINTVNSSYSYPINMLSIRDYKSLMNIPNFHFQLISNCTSPPILLVLVHSSPWNFNRRESIRKTWGHARKGLKLFFMLGKVEGKLLQKKLEDENHKHRDFVQGLFLDAFNNLTYKHVMAFKYAIYHCPKAKYILKTDDDVFVNMPAMMDYLNVRLSPYGAKNLLMCKLKLNSPVERKDGKWMVSYQEFKDEYYPPYCLGWSLLYSPDVLFTLYQTAQKSTYFKIDDVFITGILAKNQSIAHTSSRSLILSRRELEEIAKGAEFKDNLKTFLYGPENMSVDEIYLLWNFVINN